MTRRSDDVVAALGEWAAALRPGDLPHSTRRAGALLAADTVGVAIGAAGETVPSRVFEQARRRHGAGPAVVLRAGFPRAAPAAAVLSNATAGTWLELDPGHARVRTHASVHVLPVVLALSTALPTPGREALTAYVAGVEVAYRLGAAVQPPPGVHPHGVWATVGATAAAARLQDLDARTTTAAMTIAGHLMLATTAAAATGGATVRTALPAVAAGNALLACDLATSGIRGLPGAVETVTTSVLGARWDPDRARAGLGEVFETERSYVKLHACCHHLSPAVEAALELRERLGDRRRDVTGLRVATYRHAARFAAPDPANAHAAAFSLPYVVSAALRFGAVGPEHLSAPAREDAARQRLAGLVEVAESAELERAYPARRGAHVVATLAGGATVSARCDGPRGTPDRPVPEPVLEEKFVHLTTPALGREAHHTWRRLTALWELDTVDEAFARAEDRLPAAVGRS